MAAAAFAALGSTVGLAGAASASPAPTVQGAASPPGMPCHNQLDQPDQDLQLFDSCTLYISLHNKLPDVKTGDPVTVESNALEPHVNHVNVDSIPDDPFYAYFVDVQVHVNTPPGTYPITVNLHGKTVQYQLTINDWGGAQVA